MLKPLGPPTGHNVTALANLGGSQSLLLKLTEMRILVTIPASAGSLLKTKRRRIPMAFRAVTLLAGRLLVPAFQRKPGLIMRKGQDIPPIRAMARLAALAGPKCLDSFIGSPLVRVGVTCETRQVREVELPNRRIPANRLMTSNTGNREVTALQGESCLVMLHC